MEMSVLSKEKNECFFLLLLGSLVIKPFGADKEIEVSHVIICSLQLCSSINKCILNQIDGLWFKISASLPYVRLYIVEAKTGKKRGGVNKKKKQFEEAFHYAQWSEADEKNGISWIYTPTEPKKATRQPKSNLPVMPPHHSHLSHLTASTICVSINIHSHLNVVYTPMEVLHSPVDVTSVQLYWMLHTTLIHVLCCLGATSIDPP